MREVRFEVDGESVAGVLHEPTGQSRGPDASVDASSPRGGQIVLVHGLLSQGSEFEDLPERLAQKGWRVLTLDQRGFGASGGRRGIVTQERATADVRGAIAFLRKDQPQWPVGLVGHSMGAVFALRAMAEDPTIKAAVLAAPMDTVRAELKGFEFAGYRALYQFTRLGLPVRVPYKYASNYKFLYHDPEAAKRAKTKDVLQKNVDVSNYPAFMAMHGSTEAPRVKQPVLVILAEHDRAVRKASSMKVADALGGPKEIVTIKSGHSMWGDMSATAAAEHVDRWLRRHL